MHPEKPNSSGGLPHFPLTKLIYYDRRGIFMTERKAVYYGQIELIPGIICDGYVLDDDTEECKKLECMKAGWCMCE